MLVQPDVCIDNCCKKIIVPKQQAHLKGKAPVNRQADISCGGGSSSSDRMRKSSHRLSNDPASDRPRMRNPPGLNQASAPSSMPVSKMGTPFDFNSKASNKKNVKIQQSDICTSGGKYSVF